MAVEMAPGGVGAPMPRGIGRLGKPGTGKLKGGTAFGTTASVRPSHASNVEVSRVNGVADAGASTELGTTNASRLGPDTRAWTGGGATGTVGPVGVIGGFC